MELLLEKVDALRRDANRHLLMERKLAFAQYLTPLPIARLMGSMLKCHASDISILDPGAGVGSLFSAAVAQLASAANRPERITVEAYEIDALFLPYLKQTATLCEEYCRTRGVEFSASLFPVDFLRYCEEMFFLRPPQPRFHCAILNPPYRKIRSDSPNRTTLRRLGIEASNLYAGFLAVAMQLIVPGGELVSITPRSFCNGPYFKAFRKAVLRNLALQRIHVYEDRSESFKDDDVLQENVILHAAKSTVKPSSVIVSSSQQPTSSDCASSAIPFEQIVHPADSDSFIHLPSRADEHSFDLLRDLPCSIHELGLSVSTGRVVDFRAKDLLRNWPAENSVPLIYPAHLHMSGVTWPKTGRKPNALFLCDRANELLIPNANYVLVKRFTAKEERRRIVAGVYDARKFPFPLVGFENHLNYFHANGHGLTLEFAMGLAAFLNSTQVDTCFRLFSGHTQVNATDLRKLRYPTRHRLETLGREIGNEPSQLGIDQAVEQIRSQRPHTSVAAT